MTVSKYLPTHLKLRLPNPLCLKILSNPLPRNRNDLRILNSRRHTNLRRILPLHSNFNKLPKNTPKRLPTPRLGNHPPTLYNPTQRRNRPDLLADQRVNLGK